MNLSSDLITLAMPEVKSRSGAPFIFDGDSLRNLPLAPGVPVIVNVGYQPMVENFGWVNVNNKVEPKEITVANKSAQAQRVVVMLKAAEESSFSLDANGSGHSA